MREDEPGGEDYVNPSPVPGAVRDDAPPDNPPQKSIEQAQETVKRQRAEQER